jgi:hypothetical protein
MLGILIPIFSALRGRIQELRDDDRGYAVEVVVITAVVLVIAIAAVGAILNAAKNKSDDVVTEIEGAFGLY